MGEEYPLMFEPANTENLRIVLQDGWPVSHVGLLIREVLVAGCRVPVGSIGAVGTHPDARERGYGSLALADAIAVLEARRAGVMIVSGGRGLYLRASCVDAGRTSTYVIPTASLPDVPGVRTREVGPEGVAGLIEVHQREPVRFVRSRQDWEHIVRAHPLAFTPAQRRRYLLADDGAAALGYVVVQMGRAEEGQPPPPLRVVEHAGDATAVVALLRAAASAQGATAVRITVPAFAPALATLLARIAPEPPWPDVIPTTVRLIDPAALLDHLRSYLVERLGTDVAGGLAIEPGGDTFTLRLHGETATAPDRAALTWLVLGTHHTERLAWLEAAPPALRAALQAVFPLPLPLPGLNYV
jgi:hypothetical protein